MSQNINVKQKSAAEFFSEHQQIAGFDNPGKSLYTSIRELVENSLDAAESIPCIDVNIIEYTEAEHNTLHGITTSTTTSSNSNIQPECVPAMGASLSQPLSQSQSQGDEVEVLPTPTPTIVESSSSTSTPTSTPTATTKPTKLKKTTSTGTGTQRMYYKLTCRDNGCGMSSHNIGELLGRVLSGSKHGTKQTRGKFGLGAKMVRTVCMCVTIYTNLSISIYIYSICIYLSMYIYLHQPYSHTH